MLKKGQIEALRIEYPQLCDVFLQYWDTNLKDYATSLYNIDSGCLENVLKQSITEELEIAGYDTLIIKKAMKQLEQTPVLQTAHHITPTNGPSMLAFDLISLSGLKEDQIYLVGANSGVAFSNSAWSGSLSFGLIPISDLLQSESVVYKKECKSAINRKDHGDTDNRISLFPSRQRDQLVFNNKISDFQLSLYDQFTDRLKSILPPMNLGEEYSHWAAKSCAEIQKRVLNRQQIIIFDINRVIIRYLIKVLSQDEHHPINKVLFSGSQCSKVQAVFKEPSMFLTSYKGKKSFKVDGLHWHKNGLISKKTGVHPFSRQELIQALEEEKLCPGLFLVFMIVRFLNGIRCLGSFNQIGYLEEFRRNWEELDFDWGMQLEPDFKQMLTTGRMNFEGKTFWPLDMALDELSLDIKDYTNVKMNRFWEPIVRQLST